MTLEITLVLAILIGAMILFISERIRMDVVALLVLALLAITGLVSPPEALSGFSNPAVITVWAMFILSGALTATGVASYIGKQVLKLAGEGEMRIIMTVMLTAAALSAFMNNIGVVALMLPVVMDIARQTKTSPSRLLMPLAYGSLLGGLTTLIGTPPNLLASNALRESGLTPFKLFDFTPVGLAAVLGGTLFIALLGRSLLPKRDISGETTQDGSKDLGEQYALRERTFILKIPEHSHLKGKALSESRIGSAMGLMVFAIRRGLQTIPAPEPSTLLKGHDQLVVGGRLDRFNEIREWTNIVMEKEESALENLFSEETRLLEITIPAGSDLIGKTLYDVKFRRQFGVIVLAIYRDSVVHRTNLESIILKEGDRLLLQGASARIDELKEKGEFENPNEMSPADLKEKYKLQERIFSVQLDENSALVGDTLAESRLGDAFGLGVLAIFRDSEALLIPDPDEKFQAGDKLLVKGKKEDVQVLQGLQELQIVETNVPDLISLQTEDVGLVEVVLAPRTRLASKTLRQINFREKFNLQVVAIWREGRPYRSQLRDIVLHFGDALLLFGKRSKIALLGKEPDFLVLTQTVQEPPRLVKAPVASIIMIGVIIPVVLGWLHISLAAIIGATFMVLTKCINMEEAYRSIDWRPVFLIAGMLPLGIAMQTSGAANFLAVQVVSIVGQFGPWGLIVGLYLMTTIATTVVPTAALVVLMGPIVVKTSAEMGVSPHALMMGVAMAASASFTSPISHPANVLVMGPGGYRFVDYVKLGLPLTIVVMISVLLVLTLFWPL